MTEQVREVVEESPEGKPEEANRPLVEHVADSGDRSLERVAELAKEKGLPIRMRLAISLWDWAQYVAWKGQTWRVEVTGKEQAEAVQGALEEFFDLIAMLGPEEARKRLVSVRAGAVVETAQGQETDHANDPTA